MYNYIENRRCIGIPTPQDTYIFRRIEKKYLITKEKFDKLFSIISDNLTPDRYGKSTICSLYLDTTDFRLIRESIEAKQDSKAYKEKLRIRSYGSATSKQKVFLEIKKKFKGIVYKRRISLPLECAENYVYEGLKPESSQIFNEIDYAMNFYKHPKPKMLVMYEREAYYLKSEPDIRITFDTGLRYRLNKLNLGLPLNGKTILDEDKVIMEIKTAGAMPIALAQILEECDIFPTSFSKYANCYINYKTSGGEF